MFSDGSREAIKAPPVNYVKWEQNQELHPFSYYLSTTTSSLEIMCLQERNIDPTLATSPGWEWSEISDNCS